jgi:hypothetical protein
MKKVITSILGGCFLILSPLGLSADLAKEQLIQMVNIQHGMCSMEFATTPEHISEKMQMDGEGVDLQYDAYIASSDKNEIFMLLIAEYPEFVDEQFARMSLEAFLNGLLTHNPANQLLYADLVLVEGYEALDFFIRSGSMYFKGRALMVKNQLYLMAMECEVQGYDEVRYNNFVNSFSLSKL